MIDSALDRNEGRGGTTLLQHGAQREAFAVASHFRDDFFDCLTARGDTLFELTDALLCADGPVTTPVDLSLTAEHRRGHGATPDPPYSQRLLLAAPVANPADQRRRREARQRL